jgi:hypothetical protein
LTNANSNNKQNTLSLADSLTAQFITKNSTSELDNQPLVNTGSLLCGFLTVPGMTPAASTGHANPERGKLSKIRRKERRKQREGSGGKERKKPRREEGKEEAERPWWWWWRLTPLQQPCFYLRNFAVKRK